MLHESCGQGTELFAEADKLDQGRLVAILVKPVDPKAKAFCSPIRMQRPSVSQSEGKGLLCHKRLQLYSQGWKVTVTNLQGVEATTHSPRHDAAAAYT